MPRKQTGVHLYTCRAIDIYTVDQLFVGIWNYLKHEYIEINMFHNLQSKWTNAPAYWHGVAECAGFASLSTGDAQLWRRQRFQGPWKAAATPPWSLTARPWKKVVGSLLSYSQRQLFRGELLNLKRDIPWTPKKHLANSTVSSVVVPRSIIDTARQLSIAFQVTIGQLPTCHPDKHLPYHPCMV